MLISEILKSRGERLQGMPLMGATLALQMVLAAAGGPATAAPPRLDLTQARSWGYQLQRVDPHLVAASDYDLMVIDYARDGSAEQAFTAADVALMKRKTDGTSRIVLAYLSIGEAEDYRFYWQHQWSDAPPPWLEAENPDWPGNYPVRYWMPEWQSFIFGGSDSYLDAIISAGFDGVYLDRIDAFDVRDRQVGRVQRKKLMSEFVAALARYARQKQPGFVIIGQNAEELLADTDYANTIDAVAKEDLFFGLDGDGSRNSSSQVRASLTPLQRFIAAGKPVFIVEYLDTAEDKAEVRDMAADLGSPLFIGNRELDDVRSR